MFDREISESKYKSRNTEEENIMDLRHTCKSIDLRCLCYKSVFLNIKANACVK